MKSILVLLVASLLSCGLLSTAAVACGDASSSVCAQRQTIVIRLDVKKLPHQAVSLLTGSIKRTAKLTASLPREVGAQMQTGTENTQVAFRAATGQTQSTFQRFSAEVTALSLKFLRSACSYFLALLSGLMR
jgi:hypothetical protein